MTDQQAKYGIEKGRPYKYVHATKHHRRWVEWFDSGELADVYKISCEAKQITDDLGEPAARLPVNNTIAMAVTCKRNKLAGGKGTIPKESAELFRGYNADIRRLAVFTKAEIQQARRAKRPIGWQIMGTLAKVSAPKRRSDLLKKIIDGELAHAELRRTVRTANPKLVRKPIPGKVFAVAERSLRSSIEQLDAIASEDFAHRLDSVVNEDQLSETMQSVDELLEQLGPLSKKVRQRIKHAQDELGW